MPVYGFEFVGESWKHNLIFIWHCWILVSCLCLLVALNFPVSVSGPSEERGFQPPTRFGTETTCARENWGNNVFGKIVFNAVAGLFFNLFKIVVLFMGLCDTEYMHDGFRDLGSVKFAFTVLITLLSLGMDIVFRHVLLGMKFGGVFVNNYPLICRPGGATGTVPVAGQAAAYGGTTPMILYQNQGGSNVAGLGGAFPYDPGPGHMAPQLHATSGGGLQAQGQLPSGATSDEGPRMRLDEWSSIPAWIFLITNYAMHAIFLIAIFGAYCSGDNREHRRKTRPRRQQSLAQVYPSTLSDVEEGFAASDDEQGRVVPTSSRGKRSKRTTGVENSLYQPATTTSTLYKSSARRGAGGGTIVGTYRRSNDLFHLDGSRRGSRSGGGLLPAASRTITRGSSTRGYRAAAGSSGNNLLYAPATSSFNEMQEMARRRRDIHLRGLPYSSESDSDPAALDAGRGGGIPSSTDDEGLQTRRTTTEHQLNLNPAIPQHTSQHRAPLAGRSSLPVRANRNVHLAVPNTTRRKRDSNCSTRSIRGRLAETTSSAGVGIPIRNTDTTQSTRRGILLRKSTSGAHQEVADPARQSRTSPTKVPVHDGGEAEPVAELDTALDQLEAELFGPSSARARLDF
ncbi:unnamed protein product [Amoebophrya sp. A25]|nr:unnamed protein product [Amoebophrya sp. A25]|eukprot:GSA25T00016590001.1